MHLIKLAPTSLRETKKAAAHRAEAAAAQDAAVENSEGINPQKDETAVRTFVDEHIMLVRPGAAASSHDPGRGIKM